MQIEPTFPLYVARPELPIGLFDSGLGGLTVLSELRRRLPSERFFYLGDTARTPYGAKGAETILRYSKECSRFLLNQEIKLLVIACNTASSVALSEIERYAPCPVVGTIDPAVDEALRQVRVGRIGVIGTQATITSRAYEKRISELNPDVEVASKACPLFVPLVEQGMFDGEIVDKVCELYLGEWKNIELDALILGCTHYPLLTQSIQKLLGPEIRIVACSTAIANKVASILNDQELETSELTDQSFKERYFVTDEVSRFNYLARLCLNDSSVEAVKVEDLVLNRI